MLTATPVSVLFGGAGVLSYAAYGSEVQTVILVNLPSDQKFVQVVQFLYASAILLSTPLQLFPAVRIMENALFTKSGKSSLKIKWEKNTFRFVVVMACYVVAWVGASDLDKFVSFVGSFAWYVYLSRSVNSSLFDHIPLLAMPTPCVVLLAYHCATFTPQCST
jgi:hypothetical protein